MAEEKYEGKIDLFADIESSAIPEPEIEAPPAPEPGSPWDQQVESQPEIVCRQEGKRRLFGNYSWGLDIGSHSIKVVGLERSWRKCRLVYVSIVEISPQKEIPRGEEEDLRTSAVLKGLEGLDLERNSMATAMDSASVILRQISYPVSARQKLLSALRWETRRYLPFKPEEVVLDAQIMDEGAKTGKMEVLLTAVPKEPYENYMRFLDKAGIKPVLVDVGPLAVLNTYLSQREHSPEETLVFLDLGASSTFITIFRPGGTLFALSLPIGGYRFTKEVQSRCNVGYAKAESLKCRGERGYEVYFDNQVYYPLHEALQASYELLVGEVRQTLVYYNKQTGTSKFDRLILAGGGAGLADLPEFLTRKLGIETEICNSLEGIEIDPQYFNQQQIQDLLPQLSLALGLALREKVK